MNETVTRGANAWLAGRVVLHLLWWSLVATWVVGPESPSRFFRAVVLAGLGVIALVAFVPRLRRPVASFLRRRLRPLDIVAVNLVLLLVLAEVAVRIVAATSTSPLFASADANAAERIRHHRGRPHGEVLGRRFNSLGYFDTEFELARRPGVRRIVALADSFGLGVVPYEENYLTRLESLLGERAPVEVYNFGVAGIGPGEYLHLYLSEGARYDPDLVLVSFFVGNDFRRHRRRSILHAGALQSLALLQRLWKASGEAPEVMPARPEQPSFSEEAFRDIEAARLDVCRVKADRDQRKRYAETFRLLEALHEEAGPKLRVVVIPDEFQVNDALWASLTAGHEGEFDREQPNRRLAEFFGARAIPFLDLLEPLRAAERRERTYKPRDTHWNRLGNAVAAAAIARWLE